MGATHADGSRGRIAMKHARDEDDGDDGSDGDVASLGYRRRLGGGARGELFAAHIQTLNNQFLEHVKRKLREDPCAFLISASRDYVKYAKEIREEFQDVLAADAREDARARSRSDAQSGEAFVWGAGDSGQLGLGGDVDEKRRPAKVERGVMANVKVTQIATGGTHTLALASGGACFSWGNNDGGALGRKVDKQADPDAEYEPGKVELPLDVKVIMVSTGDSHGAALTESGAVWAWGSFRTTNGEWAFNPNTLDAKKTMFPFQIYTPTSSNERVKTITSGVDHMLALTQQGAVYSWGCSEKGRLGRFGEDEAEDNDRASDALKKRLLTPGRVSFGKSGGGGLGSAFGGEPVVTAIVAGDFHSIAMCSNADGSQSDVYGWGLSNCNQLGMFDPNPDLRGDQQVTYFPKKVDSLSGKRIISGDAGTHHSLFLTGDGKVIAVGRWTDGRCGVRCANAATDGFLEEPKMIDDLPGRAVKIACGGVNGGAILDDGAAYVWGSQYMGQLGLGPREEDAHVPEKLQYTKPMAGKVFADLGFGGQHSGAVLVESNGSTHASKRART